MIYNLKKVRFILYVVVGVIAFLKSNNIVYCQSTAKIENIKFDAEGFKLVITYDIVKYKEGETFEIWVKIVTASGKNLIPFTMYGDINKGVPGGPGKRIVWDLETDNVVLNEAFSVEVFGRSDSKNGTGPKVDTYKEKEERPAGKQIGVGGALALSAILPGLGNRVAKHRGAQWLLGIAGYGFVAGSVVLNRSAFNAYEDYKLAQTTSARDDFFNTADRNNKLSKAFFGVAAAIWLADLIWTTGQAAKWRKKAKSSTSFNFYYDPYLSKPMGGILYRF
jgi:hypothetical protein